VDNNTNLNRPFNHPDDCMCQDCINYRFNESKADISNEGKPIHSIRQPNQPIRKLYDNRRNGHLSIWGTALGWYLAFFEWLFLDRICILLGTDIKFQTTLFKLPHITNGYTLIFLSPIMLLWWVLVSVVYMIFYLIVILYFLLLICSGLILVLPYPIIALYSILFEYPASVINRDLNNIDTDKYEPQSEWS
jgi:hypothetical protein